MTKTGLWYFFPEVLQNAHLPYVQKQRAAEEISQTYSLTSRRFGISVRDTWFLICLPIILPYEPFCDHLVFQHGKPSNPHLWYPSGLPFIYSFIYMWISMEIVSELVVLPIFDL